MQEGLRKLEVLLDPYDWFYEVCIEPRRYVVYVTRMDSDQNIIPDVVDGYQVVVHFSNSKHGSAQDYFVPVGESRLLTSKPKSPIQFGTIESAFAHLAGHDLDDSDGDVEITNLDVLCKDLDRLERQCGPNILFDIFFEVHDGKNAVTNLGARYPEVFNDMQRIYNEYGFDAIYNELDG